MTNWHEPDVSPESRAERGRQPDAPDPADELGRGQPLEAGARTRWEWIFGRDFSNVRVHVDAAADRVARREATSGFSVGDDVCFRAGAYRPGTLAGDALIAHELAHVVQQQGAPPGTPAHGAGVAAELDATNAALSAVGRLLGGGGAAPAPRVRSGLALARCETVRTEPPTYLGAESRRALAEIDRITGSGQLLGTFIVLGTVVTMATAGPDENAATIATRGPDLTPQARALLAVPVITYSRVLTVVDLLLVSHENQMNPDERAFWQRMHDRTAQLQQGAVSRSRGAERGTQ